MWDFFFLVGWLVCSFREGKSINCIEAGLLIIEYNITEFINDNFFPLEITYGNSTSSTAMADGSGREEGVHAL